MKKFEGKTALITSGIGRATALPLSKKGLKWLSQIDQRVKERRRSPRWGERIFPQCEISDPREIFRVWKRLTCKN